MLRRFQASVVLVACLLSVSAAAKTPTDEPTDTPTDDESAPAEVPPAPPQTAQPPTEAPPAAAATVDVKPAAEPSPWHIDVNGYFRAPMALGISSRPGPDNMTGPSSTQV